jgi:hypothetical protein
LTKKVQANRSKSSNKHGLLSVERISSNAMERLELKRMIILN